MDASEGWVPLHKISKIPDGISSLRKKRKSIAIYKKDGEIVRVFEDNCPHNEKIKISDDYIIKEDNIICRFHGACWKVITGETVKGPGGEGLKIFPHRINDKDKLEILITE